MSDQMTSLGFQCPGHFGHATPYTGVFCRGRPYLSLLWKVMAQFSPAGFLLDFPVVSEVNL